MNYKRILNVLLTDWKLIETLQEATLKKGIFDVYNKRMLRKFQKKFFFFWILNTIMHKKHYSTSSKFQTQNKNKIELINIISKKREKKGIFQCKLCAITGSNFLKYIKFITINIFIF